MRGIQIIGSAVVGAAIGAILLFALIKSDLLVRAPQPFPPTHGPDPVRPPGANSSLIRVDPCASPTTEVERRTCDDTSAREALTELESKRSALMQTLALADQRIVSRVYDSWMEASHGSCITAFTHAEQEYCLYKRHETFTSHLDGLAVIFKLTDGKSARLPLAERAGLQFIGTSGCRTAWVMPGAEKVDSKIAFSALVVGSDGVISPISTDLICDHYGYPPGNVVLEYELKYLGSPILCDGETREPPKIMPLAHLAGTLKYGDGREVSYRVLEADFASELSPNLVPLEITDRGPRGVEVYRAYLDPTGSLRSANWSALATCSALGTIELDPACDTRAPIAAYEMAAAVSRDLRGLPLLTRQGECVSGRVTSIEAESDGDYVVSFPQQSIWISRDDVNDAVQDTRAGDDLKLCTRRPKDGRAREAYQNLRTGGRWEIDSALIAVAPVPSMTQKRVMPEVPASNPAPNLAEEETCDYQAETCKNPSVESLKAAIDKAYGEITPRLTAANQVLLARERQRFVDNTECARPGGITESPKYCALDHVTWLSLMTTLGEILERSQKGPQNRPFLERAGMRLIQTGGGQGAYYRSFLVGEPEVSGSKRSFLSLSAHNVGDLRLRKGVVDCSEDRDPKESVPMSDLDKRNDWFAICKGEFEKPDDPIPPWKHLSGRLRYGNGRTVSYRILPDDIRAAFWPGMVEIEVEDHGPERTVKEIATWNGQAFLGAVLQGTTWCSVNGRAGYLYCEGSQTDHEMAAVMERDFAGNPFLTRLGECRRVKITKLHKPNADGVTKMESEPRVGFWLDTTDIRFLPKDSPDAIRHTRVGDTVEICSRKTPPMTEPPEFVVRVTNQRTGEVWSAGMF